MGDDVKPTIGFFGIGIMGSRMAANIADAGYPLIVSTRTHEKGRAWAAEHHAEYLEAPAELAARADIVITMVVDGDQVKSVLLDPRFTAALRPGVICIDMSTIGPTAAVEIGGQLAAHEVAFIDAPVTGSSPKAEDATLTIMAGGDAAIFTKVEPVLQTMGSLVVHVGPVGHGQMIKLINNTLAAANTVAVGEALALAKAQGIDLDALTQVAAAGSGASTMLDLKSGPMRTHDYTTLFKLEHMLKDVRLCMEQAQAAGTGFASGAHAQDELTAALDKGFAEADFAAVIEAIEEETGVRL